MVKGRFNRPAPNPPLPCPLPYDATGRWTTETTAAARQCVLHNLERDLSWWRKQKSECGAMRPDIDGTLCRVRAQHPRSVLTNMMLLRSVNGRLQAMILQDPGDERGPMRHWPGRPVAAIQQLAAVQQRIDDGRLPPLPNFTAILNPHDSPYQFARFNWCGLAPVLSNSRVSNENRDLMMPDFSFAPFSYLTNIIDANLSAALSVPRGWPVEREAIYRSGQRLPYSAKRRVLFWRGGETHEQRRVYSKAVSGGELRLPSAVQQDVKLCGAHCSLEDGVPPEAWCDRQQLLSLPGHSFAVGFKYTLLCSSLVVRGSHAAGCDEASCPRVYEQFWHAGLSAAEHFASSRSVADLGDVVKAADERADAALVAQRSGAYACRVLDPPFCSAALPWRAPSPRNTPPLRARAVASAPACVRYAYHVLDPDFISEYWHALLGGYAALFDFSSFATQSAQDVCSRPHRSSPIHPSERVCFRGPRGGCSFKLFGQADETFINIPPAAAVARECNSTGGMQSLYRRFARLVPHRFLGTSNVSETAQKAYEQWRQGSYRKAPRETG